MKKRRFVKGFIGAAAFASLMLVGCSNETETSKESVGTPNTTENGNTEETSSSSKFTTVKTNLGSPIEGGTVNYGLVSSSPFEGILSPLFSTGVPDSQVQQFFSEGMLAFDENMMFSQEGVTTFEISEDGHLITFTINENAYWSDGMPLTARDWAFAFEVIAHPDYTEVGVRFGPDMQNIVGVNEYHAGEVDYISGIRILDERVLEIEFIEVLPSTLNNGIWIHPFPYHVFGEMAIVDMPSSPEIRSNPIGFGPFILDTIVPGESATFVRNENYWRGRPTLDGVTLRVISPDVVAQELRSGGIDLVSSFPETQFEHNADMSNIEWLGQPANVYTYIAFSLGHWDAELGENVMDPDAKMSDINLRRAMWHAVDNSVLGERFYQGLRWEASVLIPPTHPTFHNSELQRPEFSPEIAKQLLDDAGFVDVDGDGWRENSDGSTLEINFLSTTGDALSEAIDSFYLQAWHDIGLNVVINRVDFNTWVDMVGNDHPDVDMFIGAWSVGFNANPYGLYGRSAQFNRSRFVSENNDRLLAAGNSAAATDIEFRQAIMDEWQAYMIDQVPVFPTLFRTDLRPTNNRVLNVEFSTFTGAGSGAEWYQVAISSETAYVAD